ncbi:hypothetical protein B0H14DRAFT_415334 [Mycena olivaceomarginata]|nr:hypothetical protein B0H14DRAFT_415334 [Mycena olivaceomarginata]
MWSAPLLLACSLCSLLLLCACTGCESTIMQRVESVISSLFYMPAPKPTDVYVLAVAVLMMVVFYAVQPDVLTLVSPTVNNWIQTVTSFIEDNKVPLHEKANTITAQVAAIVGEMRRRSIVPQLDFRHPPWGFADEEATIFATELSQCIAVNLM